MYFSQPWMLWGLLGIVIPVVAHFLRGRRKETVEWAAFRFLEQAQMNSQSRLRIEDYLLLAVRMLIIATLVLTLAEPRKEESGEEQFRRPTARSAEFYAIDLSYSMGRLVSNRPLIESAKDFLKDRIKNQEESFRTSIYLLSQSDASLLVQRDNPDPNELIEYIDGIRASGNGLDLEGALQSLARQVESATASTPQKVNLTLITDLQALNWQNSGDSIRQLLQEISKHVRLTILTFGDDGRADNLGISKFNVLPNELISGDTANFEIEIRNDGLEPIDSTLNVNLGGVDRVERQIALDGKTSKTIEIPLEISGDGVVAAIASLKSDSDILPTDDTRYQAVRVTSEIDVLLVFDSMTTTAPNTSGSTDFVQAALESIQALNTSRSLFSTTVINSERFIQADLNDFDCIVLSNIGVLDENVVGPLRSYVEGGGSLICGLGDRIDARVFNEFARQADDIFPQIAINGDVPQLPNREPLSFAVPQSDHAIVKPFGRDEKRALATSPIEHYAAVVDQKLFETVLEFSNGEPAILEKKIGNGVVIFFATSLDDSWGYWPYWPSYVPLVAESVKYGAIFHGGIREASISEVINRSEIGDRHATFLKPVSSNTGSADTISLTQEEGLVVTAPSKPGVFKSTEEREKIAEIWVVNVDPDEGKLGSITTDELLQLISGIPIQVQFLHDDSILKNQSHIHGKRSKLTQLCLLLMSSLIISELVMRKHFYRGITLLLMLVVVNAIFLGMEFV